jgi:hypothetical protein
MKRKLPVLLGIWVTFLALSMVVSVRPAASKPRGNSGLPPGPGNPIAAIYSLVQGLQSQVDDLDERLDDIEAILNAPALVWIDHLNFLSGDTTVLTTSFKSTNSGVGLGLAGLIIQSSTTGNLDSALGNKVVEKAIQVPPNFNVTGVRLCYEWSAGATSQIDQIRLAQVQNPPSTALVLLDDATVQPTPGPVCVDSTATSVDPSLGALLLSLRINFASITDILVLRGVGLHLAP